MTVELLEAKGHCLLVDLAEQILGNMGVYRGDEAGIQAMEVELLDQLLVVGKRQDILIIVHRVKQSQDNALQDTVLQRRQLVAPLVGVAQNAQRV